MTRGNGKHKGSSWGEGGRFDREATGEPDIGVHVCIRMFGELRKVIYGVSYDL